MSPLKIGNGRDCQTDSKNVESASGNLQHLFFDPIGLLTFVPFELPDHVPDPMPETISTNESRPKPKCDMLLKTEENRDETFDDVGEDRNRR